MSSLKTPDLTWMICFCGTIWSVLALTSEFHAGGDWFTHIDAIRAGLHELNHY